VPVLRLEGAGLKQRLSRNELAARAVLLAAFVTYVLIKTGLIEL
jgi:hypothetical protein